ncbi:hypothetical protein SLEP1_g56332 [Rubroshorea leprosula]|uniref:Uncharacterized protein n=1 Tax=Rubroshorea leprosula TaxID=152421 RepID=A0AAV5MJA3_9ROSI|nr:hypothetical protein SLEP1_g56332 [Rubroshorea leprosula]
MEYCSLPNGVLWSGSPKKAGRQRGWAVESKVGRRLSSSAAGEQQRRVAGILGGWLLLTLAQNNFFSPVCVSPLFLPSSIYIYLQKLGTP